MIIHAKLGIWNQCFLKNTKHYELQKSSHTIAILFQYCGSGDHTHLPNAKKWVSFIIGSVLAWILPINVLACENPLGQVNYLIHISLQLIYLFPIILCNML